MKPMKPTLVAGLSMATVALTIGLAAPAQADDSPVNLPVTDTVRAELVQAGATLTGRPASEFTGLEPGSTYYAFAPNTTNPTYWAAAALEGATTYEAAINLQDQNSYMIFHKGGDPAVTWVPIPAGAFSAMSVGTEPCPIPVSVRDLWGWPTGKCYPPPA